MPVLQAGDGSFIGTVAAGGDETVTHMVAFEATGAVRWTVAGNYQPRIATFDGGVIARVDEGATTIFDQTGSARRQIDGLPTYSWKGAYGVGSIQSFVADWWHDITSFWSAVGGSLTGAGTGLRQKVIALNWCANHSCILTYAPQWGGPGKTDSDVEFYYEMARVGSQPNPHLELTAAQVSTVKTTAFSAFKRAFQAFPTTVLQSKEDERSFTYMVEVSGGYYFDGSNKCGLTGPGRYMSTVWYPCNLTQAQFALNLQDTELSLTPSSPLFATVLQSTGRGLGNTAAHELAHQVLDVLCGMNDSPGKVGVYDGGSADAGIDPSMYTGVTLDGQPIHWSGETAKCLVNAILNNIRPKP
jgi:hypothetical protein